MENINQIKIIRQALEKDKKKHLSQIAKINLFIDNKRQLISKLTNYLKEYQADNNLKITKTIPALYSNLHSFYAKIEKTISQAREEEKKLMADMDKLIAEVKKIEQKLETMNVFGNRIEEKNKHEERKREQTMIDDFSILNKHRGKNE